MIKYKLGVKDIFDWLLNDVKGTFGNANYVMFGMSYDCTQLLSQLPHDVTYEIFKEKRWEDEYKFVAPVFWDEYAIKLVQSKWLILYRLRDRNNPYKVYDAAKGQTPGNYVLDKKGKMILDVAQKIQILETFGYFQTAFAKVVEDMMKEEKAKTNKQLNGIEEQVAYINSAQYELDKRAELNGKALRSYLSQGGIRYYTMEERIKHKRERDLSNVATSKAKIVRTIELLERDAELIKEMKPLRGDFRTKEIEPIREYVTGELRQLAVRMAQIRVALSELDLFSTSWHGPGAVANALIKKYTIGDHFGEDISTVVAPGSPQDFAHHAFAGGRIELLRQGYMKAGYLAAYDLSSAYPAGAVELPSLAAHAGQWSHKTSDELQFSSLAELRELVEASSMVSMFKIRWFFPQFMKLGRMEGIDPYTDPTSAPIPFYPLWYRTESGRILCPNSGLGIRNREDVLAAIAWMERYMRAYPKKKYVADPTTGDKAFFMIEEVWLWEANEGHEGDYPFAILRELYGKRRAIKDDIERKNKAIDDVNKERKARGEPELPYEYDIMEKFLKLILNSVYGKLAQFVGSSNKVPNCANPYYAAAITAYCRGRLMEAALIDPAAIVFFATDGIMATRPLHHL